MEKLRFDGRTAIVTGSGSKPGLGRVYAMELASRGANVVINDIGWDPEHQGYLEPASAEKVVEEIRAMGGNAVADTNTVATEKGAAAIVKTAIDAFGGVDIIVNNAGVALIAAIDVMSPRDFQRHMEVNVLGPIWLARAAWPHMKAKKYGRIVNATSGAMEGIALMTAYSTSKGAMYSFTRAAALEGEEYGIKVNSINPAAFTRMVTSTHEPQSSFYQASKANCRPEEVAPVVVFLAHETCPVSGECIEGVMGHVRRVCYAQTPGFTQRDLTAETVAERWDEVMWGSSGDYEVIVGDRGLRLKDCVLVPYVPK
jgi:NAD(P)-dependent dehydrogenase (short-subunit alcohol dehydrogenase family)